MLLILLLFSLMLLVLLGFYVFVGAPRSSTHQTFAAFVASLAVWTIKDLVFFGLRDDSMSADWWVGISFATAMFLQFSLSIFAWVFPEGNPVPLRKAAVLFAPCLVFLPAICTGLLWESVRVSPEQFSIRLTPSAYVFGLYIYILFAYGFLILLRKYQLNRGSNKGKQLGAILWALVITVVLMSLANVVLPLAGINSFLSYGSLFVLPGVLIYAYAISSFKLFSLQSALDQFRLFPIAYKVALSIAVVAVLSFAFLQIPIVWLSFGAGPTGDAWKRYLVFSLITALVPNLILVALVIRTISRPVRQLTEAAVHVAGGKYGAQVTIESNDEVGLLASSFNEMSRKMASDIERLRELNGHLIRAEKLAATGTLAAGVAHEVNNPLASISSLVQILQAKPGADTESREMFRLISTQIERISRVLKDLMEFARVRPASRIDTEINDLMKSSIRLASFDKAFALLSVKTSFDTDLPRVKADADQVQQVFLNLLFNARDAMPDGGNLTITTRRTKGPEGITISFEDDGSGIAPEDLPRVFDPFFTTKFSRNGTGLGLAICYGIIAAHGGRITINSSPGNGAKIDVMLPVDFDADADLTKETETLTQLV